MVTLGSSKLSLRLPFVPPLQFIDLKRLWKSEPGGPAVLNLPYLLDYVMHDVCPLDWEAVLESEIPLKVRACGKS